MKERGSGIGFGLILIFIGVIAVLVQFGMLNLFRLFYFVITHIPMIIAMLLIMMGINLIFRRFYFVKILTWIAFFAVLLSSSYYYKYDVWQEDKEDVLYDHEKPILVEKVPETENGKLRLDVGGLKLNIDSTDNNLVEGVIRDPNVEYEVDYGSKYKNVTVEFNSKTNFSISNLESFISTLDNFITTRKSVMENQSDIFINDDVLWDIDLNVGGIDSELNLSRLKVEKLEVDGGAGNFKLVLGDEYPSTEVKINAGAAKFEINVPKTSGIRIDIDGWLSSKDFNGITLEQRNGYYISSDYDKAENKIEVDINMGAGELTVNGIE